jgi:hypothetical protein
MMRLLLFDVTREHHMFSEHYSGVIRMAIRGKCVIPSSRDFLFVSSIVSQDIDMIWPVSDVLRLVFRS